MSLDQKIAPVLTRVSNQLKSAAIESYRLDARMLISSATGIPANDLIIQQDRTMTDSELVVLEAYVQRRLQGEPVSRIRGVREFWSLPFKLSEFTLDPRADSETLISTALEYFRDGEHQKPSTILDLGTGTGCLLLALLKELPQASGLGVDISAGAIESAQLNARTSGLAERSMFLVDDWGASLDGSYDLIMCNPPYIRTKDIETLDPEVRLFDPRAALDGGEDGLDCYRRLIPNALNLLAPMGMFVLEIGCGQDADVASLLEAAGFAEIRCHRDLAGSVRCLSCVAP